MYRLILILALCPVAMSAKRAITHETLWTMKRVGAPAPSPDGKWVVFAVTDPAYDEKDVVSDLWITATDGSAKPRRLTFTKGGEAGATWSPDGRRIAFSAKRDGDEVPQIYILSLDGGEAQRLTSLSTAASSPKFSPDGTKILFTSMIDPEAADKKTRKYRARVYESFPIRYWDRWLDGSAPHLFVQSIDGGPASDIATARGALGDGGEDLQAVWSPDGQLVVYAAAVNRDESAYAEVRTHLFQSSVSGGAVKQLTNGPDSYAKPSFRPDGKGLYCLLEKGNDKVYNLDRVAMFAWPNPSERTIITSSFDRSVGSFAFTPDSRTLYMLAEEGGHEKLFSAPAAGGETKLVFDVKLGVYTGLAIAANAPVMVGGWESAVNPGEIVRIDPEKKAHTPISDFNATKAADIDWTDLRHFTHVSKRGKQIHSMLVLPPDFDESKKYPLLVMMHGGPHTMWRDQFFLRWNYHLIAASGYVLLLTNYTGSTGFGEKFAQEIQFDPFKGPADEINEAADEAIKRFKYIDGTRQAAAGASYGGHLANWMQATTTRYKCLVAHAGLINLESQWGTSDGIYHRERNNGGPVWEQGPVWREQNPIRYAAKFRTPIMLTVGENDFRVPLNQTLENWAVLKRLKIPSKLIVFPDANHWILKGEDSRFFYKELRAWLEKWL